MLLTQQPEPFLPRELTEWLQVTKVEKAGELLLPPMVKTGGSSKHRGAELKGLPAKGRRGSKIGLSQSFCPQPSSLLLATFLPKCPGSRTTDTGLIRTEPFQEEAIDQNRYCFLALNNKMCFRLPHRIDHKGGVQVRTHSCEQGHNRHGLFSPRLALWKVTTPSYSSRQP